MFNVISGGKLTFPISGLPSLSFAVHNSSNGAFDKSGGVAAPDKMYQNVVYGFSITPQIGKIARVHLEANYKDALEKDPDVTNARRLSAGIELDATIYKDDLYNSLACVSFTIKFGQSYLHGCRHSNSTSPLLSCNTQTISPSITRHQMR